MANDKKFRWMKCWRARRTSKFSIIVLIMKEVLPGLHWEGQIGGQIVSRAAA